MVKSVIDKLPAIRMEKNANNMKIKCVDLCTYAFMIFASSDKYTFIF